MFFFVPKIFFLRIWQQWRLVARTLKGVLVLWVLWSFKWAATWQNQQTDCVSSKDSDQPGHQPSQIRVFAVHMKKAWVLSYPLSAQRRLWSDWADAQADLSLCWTYSHFVGFVMSWLKCACTAIQYGQSYGSFSEALSSPLYMVSEQRLWTDAQSILCLMAFYACVV